MSDHPFRLPPLSELISSTSSSTLPASPPHHHATHLPPFDSTAWARNQPAPAPVPARVESENRCTPPLLPAPSLQHSGSGADPLWKKSTSPRLAPSPPPNRQPLPTQLAPQHSHPQQHSHRQHVSQPKHHTPNQSPALPFTPHSLEFPRNHHSLAQSRTSNNSYADPNAPGGGPITARQDSAVPERDLAAQPAQLHAPAPAPAATARHQDTPVLAHDHRSYPHRLLSPAPSPEHVSPLSASSQRRKTSPPPGIKISTLDASPRRSRASSDPKPAHLGDVDSAHPLKPGNLLYRANMPPPSGPVEQHPASGMQNQGMAASLQPPAEITHAALDGAEQMRCLSCHAIWSFTQPTTRSHSSDPHNMYAFVNSTLSHLDKHRKAQDQRFLQWANDHVLERVDGNVILPCLASQRASAEDARNSKRKAEVLEDALVHAKLRRLSVDSSNATQLTPPPEPNSTAGQPSRGPLYKIETDSGGVAELDENVAVLLKIPGVRPHYDAPSDDASNMWARPRLCLAHGDTTDQDDSLAPKTPER